MTDNGEWWHIWIQKNAKSKNLTVEFSFEHIAKISYVDLGA